MKIKRLPEGRNHESGQALVLIVLAIVAMFGFAALAVDFGRLYAERRRVQSAADAAALAAGFAAAQAQDYETAAFTQLHMNDIFDTDPTLNTDTRVDVEIHNPPASGAYGPDSGRPEEERNQYYQVIIHSAVDQIFSQFVYQGALSLTVEAVAHVQTASGVFDGDALHATGRNTCKALWFAGTGNTYIKGGNAFSDSTQDPTNSCGGTGKGKASCDSGLLNGSGDVVLDGGTIDTSGSWDQTGASGTIITDGPINQCQTPKDMPHLPIPDCSNPALFPSQSYTGQATISQGIYKDGIVVTGNKTKLHLNPGIYCLDSDLSMNGGEITGDGVMIYMRKGSFQLGGNTSVNLMAAGGTSLKDSAGVEWSGMLVYMPADNLGEVHIGGGANSRYSGTIYAPGPRPTEGQDKCIIEGNAGSIGLSSNIICYSIKITGKANVNINYQEEVNFHMPPTIELAQ
jgi:hypothetical protein